MLPPHSPPLTPSRDAARNWIEIPGKLGRLVGWTRVHGSRKMRNAARNLLLARPMLDPVLLIEELTGLDAAEVRAPEQGTDALIRFVSTEADDFVVKIQLRDFLPSFEKAAACQKNAEEVGVRVPAVRSTGTRWINSYMVEERVFGVDGEHPGVDPGHVWGRLGAYARDMASIEMPGFGRYFVDDWASYMNARIARVLNGDGLLSRNLLDESEYDRIKSIIADLKRWNPIPRLHHGDLMDENVIVSPGGDVTLIDWSDAQGHHEHYSLIEANCMSPDEDAFAAFCEGYGISFETWLQMRHDLRPLLALCLMQRVIYRVERKGGTETARFGRLMDGLHSLIEDSLAGRPVVSVPDLNY